MPKLNIFQSAFRVGHEIHAHREILQIDKITDARIVRKVEGHNQWEWRATTELGCARVIIFGFSKSLNDMPKKWYPLQDSDPIDTCMTDAELRETAIMAVRGACYENSKHPETVTPIDALILLIRIVTDDPDLIFAKWFEKAIHGDEIHFFLREWEKNYVKNFLPKTMPRSIV